MISETMTFLRFLRRKRTLNRGFLVLCESLDAAGDDDDDDGGDDWEERVAGLKSFLKQREDVNQKEMKRLQQNLARIEDKTKYTEEKLEQKFEERMKGFETELKKMRREQEEARNEQNEKQNQILALLTQMNQNFANQQNHQA